MDYSHIQSFFGSIKKIVQKDDLIKDSIIFAFKKYSTVEVVKQDISFKGSILIIKSSPLIKNEILFKKNLILDAIKELSGKQFTDIR